MMKTAFWGAIVCVTTLLIFATCVTTQKANISIEDIAGTWINEEYNHIASPISAKVVVTADGVLKTYDLIEDEKHGFTFKLSIVESWYDENGDIWFRAVSELIGPESEFRPYTHYILNRLSDSVTIWKRCGSTVEYPTELSKLAGSLSVYFRQ